MIIFDMWFETNIFGIKDCVILILTKVEVEIFEFLEFCFIS